jgi:hypothetical protein
MYLDLLLCQKLLGSLFPLANIPIDSMGTNNSYPDLRLESANGNDLGIATTATSFSSSAGVNDMVLRSLNRLILLQSGGNAYSVLIDANNNYVNINNRLITNGTANFHNGSPLGITYVQFGPLTIGGTNADYGGSFYTSGPWTGTNMLDYY